ncbi:MAG: hypothetical protein RL112_406, partial [Planctomycetota bacterium]
MNPLTILFVATLGMLSFAAPSGQRTPQKP